MTLRKWIEKLAEEHKETQTEWDNNEFKKQLKRQLPELKNANEQVWEVAYAYYKEQLGV